MKKIIKKQVIIFFTLFSIAFVFPLSSAVAAMQSDSYIIYENIHHLFDGPTISNVNSSVSGTTATITWTTNVDANSFVEYSTDSALAGSKEQGTSVKSYTSHSVELSGLTANTLYYYRVKSERVNGGMTTDSTIRSFTSGADSTEPATHSSGGGLLIIDKTDDIPPEISQVSLNVIDDTSVRVNWQTDEDATSFVEYGQSVNYGSIYGEWSSTTVHQVELNNLSSNVQYHYRALSSDDWGNVGYSEDLVFTIIPGEEKGKAKVVEEETKKPVKPPEVIEKDLSIIEKTRDLLARLFPDASLNELNDDELLKINSLEDVPGFIKTPVLSGFPQVEISATKAKITWTTDIDANSMVAFAPQNIYKPGETEPYQQIVGNSDESLKSHEVTLYNLSPDTVYHYQLRSKSGIGQTARSIDYTFRTSLETLEITSFFSQIIDNQTVIFKWVTNKESDATVKIAPYHNNILAIDESKSFRDNNLSVIHEIRINEFQGGVVYEVELDSIDSEGNVATEIINRFSTSEDDLPPIISQIKADSTVFLDDSNKTQTIISWETNEPSTSQVYFQKGVFSKDSKLENSTTLNTNYTKEHVIVVTKFEPGTVYSFRVESIDSGGNTVISNTHTFMTAMKKKSIIQIIIGIFEDTFSWMNEIF